MNEALTMHYSTNKGTKPRIRFIDAMRGFVLSCEITNK